MARANPLDSIATPLPTGGSLDFKVPKVPALYPLVQRYGLMVGLRMFDESMERWHRDLERALKDRLTASTGSNPT